jgi:WD40 repeat protein
VVFSPDGQRLVSAGLDRVVRLWDVQTGQEDMPRKEPIRMDGPEPEKKPKPWVRRRPLVPRIAFNADGRRLASINAGQPVQLWDVATHLEILTLPVKQSAFQYVAFSRDGHCLVATVGCGCMSGTRARPGSGDAPS